MGSLQQVSSSPFGASKFRAERNRHMTDEHREVRDGVVGEGQGLSEEDESRINEGVNDGVGRRLLQQQPVVRWERFLPVRSLKVLLVESDDSTRQLVSALLRNSSYEGYAFLTCEERNTEAKLASSLMDAHVSRHVLHLKSWRP